MTSSSDKRFKQIGIDRLIRLRWLEQTADLVLAGYGQEAIKIKLQGGLRPEFPTSDMSVRGSLDKTITMLMKIWVRPPLELQSLQQKGLSLYPSLPEDQHIALHWGMVMSVYPFWGAVAHQVGRLLNLQKSFEPRQIQRRIREQYGERETVSRRVRYILRSFVDWDVLRDRVKGVYVRGDVHQVQRLDLIAWLTEAYLHAQPNGIASPRVILNNPSLFPFQISYLSAGYIVAQSPHLKLLRHGLDDELVALQK